jgi:hypothetical protein
MRIMRCGCVLFLWLAAFAVLAGAQDTVVLKDGRELTGAIQWETQTQVGLKVEFGLIQIDRAEIQEIRPSASADPQAGRARKGIMNLAGPTPESVRQVGASSRERPPVAPAADDASPSDVTTTGAATGSTVTPGERIEVPHTSDENLGPEARIRKLFGSVAERLRPVFPGELSTKLAVALLLFLLTLGLVQIGCRLVDVENFSLARGVLFNTVLGLAMAGGYSLRHLLNGPLVIVLAVLGAFVVLAAAASALFQERAGKSTMLVAFVVFAGGICLTCITVGVIGVMNLY